MLIRARRLGIGSLLISAKHFHFYQDREWGPFHKWWRRVLVIAFVQHHSGYRYVFWCEFQLLPNFIWWQDVIDQGDKVLYSRRIAGIQNWPFYFSFRRYPKEATHGPQV